MAYKQIDERFWKDKKIKQLSKDGYLLFLYLLTSPHTHYTGLSEMTLDYVNIDTPLLEKESKAAYKELVALELIKYDPTNELVWIVNMHKYHIKSEKHIKFADKHIHSLPKSILCKELADTLLIPYRYPIDTLFSTENTLSASEKYPIDISKSKSKSKSKKEVKVKVDYENEFKEFWELYPSKVEKKKSRLAFNKIMAEGKTEFKEIMEGLRKYVTCKKVKDGFVKMPTTWLNGENWADDYEVSSIGKQSENDYSLEGWLQI